MKVANQSAVLLALMSVGLVLGCNGGGGGSSSGKSVAPITSAPITTGTAPITTAVAPIVSTAPPVVAKLPSRYLYTANSGDDTVTPFKIDATTGVPTAGTAVAAASGVWDICAHPSGKYLYVLGSTDVSSFAIDDATGNIQQIAGQTVTIPGVTWGITCDPTGSFVIVCDSSNVTSLKVGANGALTNAGSVALAGKSLKNVLVDPTGKFAYVTGSGTGDVTCLLIEAGTGALKVASTAMAGAGARPLAMDPTGKFLVVGNNTAKTVSVFTRNALTGGLSAVGTALPVSGSPYAVSLSADGKFAYVGCDSATNVASSINQFAMDNLGALTPLSPATAPGCDWPLGIAIDNSGKFAFTPNYGFNTGNSITAFTVDAKSGVMTVNGTAVSAGATSDPHGIAIVK